MLESDPDAVASLLSQVTSGLYSSLKDKMAMTDLSSAFTIYNDKQMKTNISNLETSISDWEDKIADMEDYYYNKFTIRTVGILQLISFPPFFKNGGYVFFH